MTLNSLTGIRGILALFVVIAHASHRCGWLAGGDMISGVIGVMGHFGVIYFFLLSGFIMTHVYSNGVTDGRKYFVNRFARIYPMYILCLLIAFPLDWLSPAMPEVSRKLAALSLSLISMQSWFEFSNARFNGPSWTIGVEMMFYVCFPLLFLFRKHGAKLFLLVMAGLVVVNFFVWAPGNFYTSFRFPLLRLWEFMAGMMLYRVAKSYSFFFRGYAVLGIGLVFLGPLLGGGSDWARSEYIGWFLMAICAGASLVLLGSGDLNNGTGSRFLSTKTMIIGGEISYGLYLLHDPIQRYARFGFEKIWHTPLESMSSPLQILYCVSTSVAAVVLSYILWAKFETPARLWLRKKLHRPVVS